MFDSRGRREAQAGIGNRVECTARKQAEVVEMSVHKHVVNGSCRRRSDLVEMNEPVTKEMKETHDDGIALRCFDPITLS